MYLDSVSVQCVPFGLCFIACLLVGLGTSWRSRMNFYMLAVSGMASLLYIIPNVGDEAFLSLRQMISEALADSGKAVFLSLAALALGKAFRLAISAASRPNSRLLTIDRSYLLRSVSRGRHVDKTV